MEIKRTLRQVNSDVACVLSSAEGEGVFWRLSPYISFMVTVRVKVGVRVPAR